MKDTEKMEKLDCDPADWGEIVNKKSKIELIVSDKQLKNILHELDNELDDNGYIINSKTKERELSNDGDDIRLEEVGGVLTGSKVIVKKNIASFSEHLIEKKTREL